MSGTARRAPALLPSGRRLNWWVRSANDHEAAIRRLSGLSCQMDRWRMRGQRRDPGTDRRTIERTFKSQTR
jgi:hypothetical protein